MKTLLAFLVTFSVFASDHFVTEKENALKKLQASNAAPSVITCVQNAKSAEEMNACEKENGKHEKVLRHKVSKIKHT